MKGRTITVPVVTGTCAFYLGKKASWERAGRPAPGPGREERPCRRPPPAARLPKLRRRVWRAAAQPALQPYPAQPPTGTPQRSGTAGARRAELAPQPAAAAASRC